ncbi:capsular biosynthesis protein [Xenorhabdus bovienii]|uniref:capsular biosynthesis protein n=1 Tax=Xenorhabdus bovienii TaxID=40576 RepID=UPI0023B2AF5D|nr:capsular biosynthesis protein [Xenorhabdus bovienii]MDE9461683.1 capsular biosynthesis protein [Xenorhabdus bovienii]MDE9469875.1 capsular biosynthesis protein [Xenorhabdus bovienii]MDE9534049.1 capsular biosynthesis protein [Xenorhabdus bovienii]MDE9586978.1 capsular biosynthesis protein [Xenorhabdus bovienii]
MSAAYVGQDLKAEFGDIPPCMLPLGNKRLYTYQIELAEKNEDIYISLPESYKLSQDDKAWFIKNNIEIIYLPDGITLGESLVTAINSMIFKDSQSLKILFGDTLIKPVPSGENIIVTSEKNDGYSWGSYEENESIIAGYFSISDPGLLVRSIIKSRWNFVDGIKVYNKNKTLETVNDLDWYDFGHINKYYQSKAAFTTQRAFNDLKINRDWIEKRSSNNLKIKAEANWFSSLPSQLRIYTPQYLGDAIDEYGTYSYQLEYLYNTPLNELYIFSEIEPTIWNKIIKKCFTFVDDCLKFEKEISDSNCLKKLFSDKTRSRINLFLKEQNFPIDKTWSLNLDNPVSLEKMINETESFIDNILIGKETIIHGDFCFSNILYDFRTDRIKVIDPRGMDTKGDLTIYGNMHYDITKLAHSIIGLYDWIISGFYELNIDAISGHIDFKINLNKDVSQIQSDFVSLSSEKYNISYKALCAMQVHLFISMLPLHNDDQRRQYALLANALRLFKEFNEAST